MKNNNALLSNFGALKLDGKDCFANIFQIDYMQPNYEFGFSTSVLNRRPVRGKYFCVKDVLFCETENIFYWKTKPKLSSRRDACATF